MAKNTSSHERVSEVSHKLRTPLTVIMSTVNNLLDGAFGKLNADQTSWLKKLEIHTAHLENLLNEIIGLLKAENESMATPSGSFGNQSKKVKKSSSKSSQLAVQHLTKDWVPTILIVDDEPDIVDTIQEAMQMKGFNTLTANNGKDAIKIALKKLPDLILMDVLLKTQNGVEVCGEIKARLESFTPVLLVTGQNDLSNKITGGENSPDDLLMKPFQMEELFSRVASMLRIKKLNDELNELQTHLNQRISKD